MTVSESLQLVKAIKQRASSLEKLRDQVSVKETYYSATNKISEPLYDVKEVDNKLVSLNQILFTLESAIKQSNAVTNLSVNISTNDVFEALK